MDSSEAIAVGDDLSARLRDLAFGTLVDAPTPVETDRLATLSGMDLASVQKSLDALARAGLIDRDESGRLVGSAGLTIADGPHGLLLGDHRYHTWCAFDAIGIPAALGWDAQIETACAVCGRTISVQMTAGVAPAGTPARLWLSAGGRDMRADFCTPTVLLCSDEHARAWADRHGHHGRALTLERAAVEGAMDWRSAADVALELGSASGRLPATDVPPNLEKRTNRP
jgi:alkylmercury lyase